MSLSNGLYVEHSKQFNLTKLLSISILYCYSIHFQRKMSFIHYNNSNFGCNYTPSYGDQFSLFILSTHVKNWNSEASRSQKSIMHTYTAFWLGRSPFSSDTLRCLIRRQIHEISFSAGYLDDGSGTIGDVRISSKLDNLEKKRWFYFIAVGKLLLCKSIISFVSTLERQ